VEICIYMADKVAFLATMPPADTPRISTMLGYALAAVSMGFDVLIFWTLEGAHVVKEKVFEKLDKQIQERFKQCLEMGCKMWLCSSAAATFNYSSAGAVVPPAHLAGLLTSTRIVPLPTSPCITLLRTSHRYALLESQRTFSYTAPRGKLGLSLLVGPSP
jgi:predicted peroxiredoxin